MLIWDNFSTLALIVVAVTLVFILIGLVASSQKKLKDIAICLSAFFLILGFGQSQDLMHLHHSVPSALVQVLASIFVAISSFKLTQNKWALLLLLPVSLIVFVFFYNLQFKDIGISLFSSWIA